MTENNPGGWVAGLNEAARKAPNQLHRQMSAYYAKLIQNDMDAGRMPRTAQEAGMESPLSTLDEVPTISHSMFSVDYNSREVIVVASGNRFSLSPTQLGIVRILQSNCGNFVRPEGFQSAFEGLDAFQIREYLKGHVRNLRKKFDSNGVSVEGYPVGLIESSKNSATTGLGYRMLDPKRYKPLNLGNQENAGADESNIVSTHSRLTLNLNTRLITTKSDNRLQVPLTRREFELYLFLLQNMGRFVEAKKFPIFEGFTPYEIQESVKVYIARIRRKFEKSGIIEEGFPSGYIEGGRGRPSLGYRIIDPALQDHNKNLRVFEAEN